jgi:hypothetical protein
LKKFAAAKILMGNSPVNKGNEGGTMIRTVSLILAIILTLACSGCYWDHRGGYGDRDRDHDGRDGDRHEDRRDHDDHDGRGDHR